MGDLDGLLLIPLIYTQLFCNCEMSHGVLSKSFSLHASIFYIDGIIITCAYKGAEELE